MVCGWIEPCQGAARRCHLRTEALRISISEEIEN
jgi:hypothetical protein